MKKQRKIKYFGRFCNQKEFFGATIEAKLFDEQPLDLEWYYAKLLLRHKDCTHDFRMRYVQSKIWYERLVACLAKPARAQYAIYAMKDSDKRVRFEACRGRYDPSETITSAEAANLVMMYLESHTPRGTWDADMYRYADSFLTELKQATKSPALGLLSPNPDIRRITKERLDVLSKVQR